MKVGELPIAGNSHTTSQLVAIRQLLRWHLVIEDDP